MIGGNTKAILQMKSEAAKNEIGQNVTCWQDVQVLTGWLDLVDGDSKFATFNTKMQESTHIFIADYTRLDSALKAENSRVIIDGTRYEVQVIDDPMGLHKQIEIYLRYTGGQ